MKTSPSKLAVSGNLYHRPSRRPRRGITVVYFVIIGLVLIGLVGLAADTGYVFLVGHQLQNAADAAALAGAQEVKFSTVQASTDAVNAASKNKAAGATVQLDANNGDVQVGNYDRPSATFTPNTAPYNAVSVLARRTAGSPGGPINLIFGPIFGVNTSNVSRTAIAMTGGTLGAGLILLDPTRPNTFSANGHPTIDVNGGAIQVNSANASAVDFVGSATINASELRVDGGVVQNGNTSLPSSVVTGATPVADPLAGLPPPTIGTDLGTVSVGSNQTVSIGPGYYSGGISMTSSGATLHLSAGIYALGPPGIHLNGGTLDASAGVMFYLTHGTGSNATNYGVLNLGGNGTTNITPPSTGTYAGVAIFEDRSAPYSDGATVIGTSGLNINGTIYLPSVNLAISGTSSNFANQIIADTLSGSGNGTIQINYDGRNRVTVNNVFLVK